MEATHPEITSHAAAIAQVYKSLGGRNPTSRGAVPGHSEKMDDAEPDLAQLGLAAGLKGFWCKQAGGPYHIQSRNSIRGGASLKTMHVGWKYSRSRVRCCGGTSSGCIFHEGQFPDPKEGKSHWYCLLTPGDATVDQDGGWDLVPQVKSKGFKLDPKEGRTLLGPRDSDYSLFCKKEKRQKKKKSLKKQLLHENTFKETKWHQDWKGKVTSHLGFGPSLRLVQCPSEKKRGINPVHKGQCLCPSDDLVKKKKDHILEI